MVGEIGVLVQFVKSVDELFGFWIADEGNVKDVAPGLVRMRAAFDSGQVDFPLGKSADGVIKGRWLVVVGEFE